MVSRRRFRFLLISIIPKLIHVNEVLVDLKEMKALIESYGGELVDLVTQRREIHDKGSFIGDGKIEEAATLIRSQKIDFVVLNGSVKPGQIFEMKSIFMRLNKDIEVWDRIDLILQIFAKHAHTKEARLQIELAAMRHMGPRIYGMGMELSRQTGGIGTRGIGETNTELMKRHWRAQMKKIGEKLDKLIEERRRQLEHRKRIGLKTVSLVGYTNAGKTSLFNQLTKKHNLVRDALFVTLDSTVGKVFLPKSGKEIVVSDTIGFIKNLPADLVESFKSTLLESINADIILHVIDASDKDFYTKISVVEDILFELEMDNKKRIYVFNKIDATNGFTEKNIRLHYQSFPVQFISVRTAEGLQSLLKRIENELEGT